MADKKYKYAAIPDTDLIVFSTILDTSKKTEVENRPNKTSGFADMVEVNCDLAMPDYLHDAVMHIANEAVSVVKHKSEVEKQRKLAKIKNSIIGIMFKVSFYATVINFDEILPPERMEVLRNIVKASQTFDLISPTFDLIEVKDPEHIKEILNEVLGQLEKKFNAGKREE